MNPIDNQHGCWAVRYALPSGECSIALPKSTKCGAPIGFLFHAVRPRWRAIEQRCRSIMRVKRAKLKSRRDDMIIAQQPC